MKKMNFQQLLTGQRAKIATAMALAAVHGASHAANLGGLDTAKSTAEDVKTGIYAFVGVLALLYLLYLGVMAFAEKKSWSDFGFGVVHVALVGATTALGTWAWLLGRRRRLRRRRSDRRSARCCAVSPGQQHAAASGGQPHQPAPRP